MHTFDEDLGISVFVILRQERDVLIWAQLFLSGMRYGYNKSCIARFLGKNHATVIQYKDYRKL